VCEFKDGVHDVRTSYAFVGAHFSGRKKAPEKNAAGFDSDYSRAKQSGFESREGINVLGKAVPVV
jgi:hypothetical protein